MNELQIGLNILLNCAARFWEFFTSSDIPLVNRMLFLSPFVVGIYTLITSVFGGSVSGKTGI